MDEDDRESNASSDNDRDEVMEDAYDGEGDNNEAEEEENDDEGEDNDREETTGDKRDTSVKAEGGTAGANSTLVATDGRQPRPPGDTTDADDTTTRVSQSEEASKSPQAPSLPFPTMRAEAVDARHYDIIPTMAAPQATSINAISVTPDLRYWMTGGSDGYIRKYDGPGTINGKQLLTVAQRHPFVDSVVKAGVLMSYWENEEPPSLPGRGADEHVLSPVYSLAVQSQALWLLSGLESGGINLQSVRHDEGKRITCLQQHTNAVSVLVLAQDEKSVLSGSWDKSILDWDLNTGGVKRKFDGIGGQVSAIEVRPVNGAPIPAEASELFSVDSDTISTSIDKSLPNGSFSNANGTNGPTRNTSTAGGASGGGAAAAAETQASPAHESLFGGSDTGSLFGETVGGGFGGNDDDDFSGAMGMSLHDGSGQDGGMDHSADMAMANSFAPESSPPPAVQPPGHGNNGEAAPSQTQTQPPVSSTAAPADTSMADDNTGPTYPTSQPEASVIQPEPSAFSAPAPLPEPALAPAASSQPLQPELDPTQSSDTVFFSAAFDGSLRVWDRRVQDPVARIGTRPGVPPWCMGACWSPDGNWIHAGRRNGTVEEYSMHKARSGWEPERTLKMPGGSGPVSAVRAMPNGRHLVCASHDILRLYDLRASANKHSSVPFLIIPGPPRAGVISSLYIDRTCRFMISTAGTRGWEGTNTEVLIGYEINAMGSK